ncbi:hypothetical protein ACGFNU_23925 [Spirillospora sp. NPDC048911]|uniref:hypothetical protein n=1 Tax=Spirillospora sp. NPDC048911 TaxID=3364527 RepID=UPI00371EE1C5
MAGKKAELASRLAAVFGKLDALNTPKRIGVLIVAFVVMVGLLEVAALQLGHVQVPLLGGDDGGTAAGG